MNYKISSLDGETLVIEIEPGDEGPVVEVLDMRGHGYAVWGEGVSIPFAVIDRRLLEKPGYTENHLLAIEAHELGHIHESSDDESTAEKSAIRILTGLGNQAAADLLRTRGVI
jgi:hypothetical protein